MMPRLGIAYRPTEKWVIRTGAGMFDNIDHINTWTILNLNPPLSGSTQYTSVTDGAGTIMVTGADGKPYNATLRQFRPGNRSLRSTIHFCKPPADAASSAQLIL